MGVMENRNARPEWGIDAMLIDEELLYLEDKEADHVYQELMEKSARRRQMEARENRLSKQMSLDDSSETNSIIQGGLYDQNYFQPVEPTQKLTFSQVMDKGSKS
jgi:hypothetical protein